MHSVMLDIGIEVSGSHTIFRMEVKYVSKKRRVLGGKNHQISTEVPHTFPPFPSLLPLPTPHTPQIT